MPTYEIQLKETRVYIVRITAPNGEKAYEAFMESYETHVTPENGKLLRSDISVKPSALNEYGALHTREVKTK